MSSYTDVPFEQICYITCNFCNIILAVSVPCSSLFDMVTVRCGHCTNLLSVNMAAALQSLSWQNLQTQNFLGPDYRVDLPSSSRNNNMNDHHQISTPPSTNSKSEGRIVNRPPEKKQRVPSAYNQFIKEEIQRIKANNPDISHREAFSTAAKSWAHYPHHNNHSAAAGSALETNIQANNKVQEKDQKNEE